MKILQKIFVCILAFIININSVQALICSKCNQDRDISMWLRYRGDNVNYLGCPGCGTLIIASSDCKICSVNYFWQIRLAFYRLFLVCPVCRISDEIVTEDYYEQEVCTGCFLNSRKRCAHGMKFVFQISPVMFFAKTPVASVAEVAAASCGKLILQDLINTMKEHTLEIQIPDEPDLQDLEARSKSLEWYNQWVLYQRQPDDHSQNSFMYRRRMHQVFYISTFQRDPRCLSRAGLEALAVEYSAVLGIPVRIVDADSADLQLLGSEIPKPVSVEGPMARAVRHALGGPAAAAGGRHPAFSGHKRPADTSVGELKRDAESMSRE